MVFSSSSAKLTSCEISNSKAGKVRKHASEAGCVQEGAAGVRCCGSAARRCHVFHSFIFCNTQLLHDQDQQIRNKGTKACIGSCRKGLTW